MIEHMATVLHHSRARGTDKLVLLGIANHAGDGGSWPTVATLAKYANVDERSVQRAIANLEELGEISVHLNEGGTRQTRADRRPNRYEVLVRCPQECDGTPQHRVPAPVVPGDESRPGDGDSDGTTWVSPREQHGATPTSPRGPSRGDTRVANGVTPVSPEPSLEPPRPTHGTEPASPTVPRRPDDVWHAVLGACLVDPTEATTSALSAWTKAVSELRRVGATPTEVRARADRFRRAWPAATLTPTALARRWAEIPEAAAKLGLPLVDPVAQSAGLGRNLARTDIPDAELEQHVPVGHAEADAFRGAFLAERCRLKGTTVAT